MSAFSVVKTWFQGGCIKVPDDWLEACLEWLQEENQGASLSNEQLTGMVYEQFLAADMRELQTPCLPPAVAQEAKYMLQGVFCLQVDSLMDVSQPYYGQLQKVRGTENPNVHVSATQATQPAPDMKAGRVLMLKMTDGVTDVQGIEYRPIPALNTNLLPGCKIRIKGRLLCRNSVLFLKSENLEVLGGEVDSLVESNKQDILLQKALSSVDQVSRNNQKKEFSNTEIVRQSGNISVSGGRQGQTTVQNLSRKGAHSSSIQSKPVSNVTQSKSNSRSNNTLQRNQNNMRPTNPEDEMDDDDDFLESLGTTELAALDQEWDENMDDMYAKTRQTSSLSSRPVSHVNRLNSEPNKRVTTAVTGQKKPLASVSGTQLSKTSQSRLQGTLSRPSQLGQPAQSGNIPSQNKPSGHISSLGSGQRSKITTGLRPEGKSMQDMESEIEMELENLADFMDDDFPMDDFNDSSVFYPSEAKKPKAQPAVPSGLTRKSSDRTCSGATRMETKPTAVSTVPPVSRMSSLSSVGRSMGNPSTGHGTMDCDRKIDTGQTCSLVGSDVKVGGANSRCPVATVKSLAVQPTLVHMPLPDFSKFAKPSDLIAHLKKATSSSQLHNAGFSDSGDEPFVYLSSVESKLQMKQAFCIKVKGYVATLLSRLDSGQGLGWNLTCRVNDGTGTLDVDLTDEVLAKLIGFSAQKTLEMKKGDVNQRNALSEGIRNCQLKLINISCIFRVSYQPSAERARVIEILPITKEHIQKLYTRVCHQMSGR